MFRTFLRMAIGGTVAILLLRTFVVEGLLVPQRIASGSMAPTLLGPHHLQSCSSCGFRWSTDATAPSATAISCPQCGSLVASDGAALSAGQRVLIDRASWLLRPPRRFEVAAYRTDSPALSPQVKRIVGLPGEQITLSDGDVFVNDQRLVKSLDEQRQVAILCHTDRSAVPHAKSAAWHVAGDSAWQRDADGWRRHRQTAAADRLRADWLAYRLPADVSCVYDDYPYNAGTSRRLNCSKDLMLTCHIRCLGDGQLTLRVDVGGGTSLLVLHPRHGRLDAIHNSQPVPTSLEATTLSALRRLETGAELTVSTFDRQLLLAVDERVVFRWPLPPAADEKRPAEPFALAAQELEVRVGELRLWRDIYYLSPPTGGLAGQVVELSADGYFMLGDNSPVSRDGRDPAQGPEVRANQLLGRVLAWPLP